MRHRQPAHDGSQKKDHGDVSVGNMRSREQLLPVKCKRTMCVCVCMWNMDGISDYLQEMSSGKIVV